MKTLLTAPAWPVLRVFGPDAARWLSAIVTSDVTSVSPGKGSWALLLNKQGKIQAELQIVGKSDELFLVVSGGQREETLEILDGYLIMEDAQIESTNLCVLVALGDQADEVLALGSVLPWPTKAVLEVLPQSDLDARVWGDETSFCGDQQFLDARVEAGLATFGIDYDHSDNPHAASLERRAVDWSKGCYLGQEVVCMQDMRGKVKRRLVKLRADEGMTLEPKSELWDQSGNQVGSVTSASREFGIGKVSAPAYEDGTALTARSEGGSVAVTVLAM